MPLIVNKVNVSVKTFHSHELLFFFHKNPLKKEKYQLKENSPQKHILL